MWWQAAHFRVFNQAAFRLHVLNGAIDGLLDLRCCRRGISAGSPARAGHGARRPKKRPRPVRTCEPRIDPHKGRLIDAECDFIVSRPGPTSA